MINDCEIICLTPVFSTGIVGKQEDAAYRDNSRRSGAPSRAVRRRKWKLFPSIWCDSRCSSVKRAVGGAVTSRPDRDRDEDRCRRRLLFVRQASYDSLHKISHLLSLHAGEKSTSGKSGREINSVVSRRRRRHPPLQRRCRRRRISPVAFVTSCGN